MIEINFINEINLLIGLLESERDLAFEVDSLNIYSENYELSLDNIDKPLMFSGYDSKNDEYMGNYKYNIILDEIIEHNSIFDEPIIKWKCTISKKSCMYNHFLKLYKNY